MSFLIKLSVLTFSFYVSLLVSYAQQAESREIDSSQLFVQELSDLEEFRSLAHDSEGVIRSGYTIKFIIDKRRPENPQVYFLNANYCSDSSCKKTQEGTLHYYFARKVIPNFSLSKKQFEESFYYTSSLEDRPFIGGRIQSTEELVQNGQKKVILGARFIERDLANEEMIRFTMQVLKQSIATEAELAFVVNSSNHTVDTVKNWFFENKVGLYTMEELISHIPYIGLNPGIAYGIVNYFPEDPDDLEPYDLAVFDQVPVDLPPVAGTITHSYQDSASHVNLISKERPTPNMVLREASELARLKSLHGKPVKLTVGYHDFQVEELSGPEIVFEEYEKKIDKDWQKPAYRESLEMVSFDQMCDHGKSPGGCLDRAQEFGGKAAGMAFLAHPKVVGPGSSLQTSLGYRLSPMGFGVPLTAYRRFVKHNYSGEFREKLDRLILTEMGESGHQPLPTQQKKQLVQDVRQLFLEAEIPTDLFNELQQSVAALAAEVAKQYPGEKLKKVKVRSSANTEDIDGFNGAGLHDSFAAKLKVSDENTAVCKIVEKLDEETRMMEEKVEPRSLACAVKGVFASLWSLRAVRERSYRRFDHRFAVMGLAAQPAYTFRKDIEIAANSVLITRVLGATSVFGQQMSSQFQNGLVTNPTPDTRAELVNVTFQSSEKNFGVNVLQYAKPFSDEPAFNQTVMNKEQILLHSEVARTVEKAYCEARQETYFPGRDCRYVTNSVKKLMALDMEFKFFDNNEVLIKQVRTFSGH